MALHLDSTNSVLIKQRYLFSEITQSIQIYDTLIFQTSVRWSWWENKSTKNAILISCIKYTYVCTNCKDTYVHIYVCSWRNVLFGSISLGRCPISWRYAINSTKLQVSQAYN